MYDIKGKVFVKCGFYSDEIVTIPEGVEEIGAGAFYYSKAKKIILPSSLKRISARAFTACQATIDFADCSLEVVEDDAFAYVSSFESDIPDSVKRMGSHAFSGAKGFKNNVLRIPKSLESYEMFSFKGHYAEIAAIDVSTLNSLPGILRALNQGCSSSIKVNVLENDETLFSLAIFEYETDALDAGLFVYPFLSEGYNVEVYDKSFNYLRSNARRWEMALARLDVPYRLLEKYKAAYVEFLYKHFCDFYHDFHEDIETLKILEKSGIITKRRINRLIENANESGNFELLSHLMDFKNSNFGFTGKSLKL
jgi:hypothetical protein